jgi:hypothetical protein
MDRSSSRLGSVDFARALALAAALALVAAGCRGEDRRGPEALGRADAAATKLGGTLRTKLGEAMARGGPTSALDVCAVEAPQVRAAIARDARVTLGRASLRLRTPADAPPDWVDAWLKAAGERKAEGVIGVHEVVDTPRGKVARVLRPIAIEAPCLTCHGDEATVTPAVRDAIRAKYPTDTAMGYHLGDLRGALWVEAPLE